MKKKLIAILFVILAALAIGIGVANACPPHPFPRYYCVNEPTRHHGHAVNHITCYYRAYNPNGR